MLRRRLLAVAATLLAAAVALAGCGSRPQPAGQSQGTEGGGQSEEIVIAIVPKGVHPYFDDTRKGAEERARELGVKFEWVSPPQFDAAIQVKMIEDLIAKGVDGIAISPNDPKSVEGVIADAIAKGIKVITFDADAPESKRLMYIGTDNKQAGIVGGETIAQLLDRKGKVVILTGGLGALNLNQRVEGVKEAIQKYPDMQVVDVQSSQDDMAKAVSVVESILRSHPDLNGIVAVSAEGGPAIAQVLMSNEFKDRAGKVKVVAFDDLPQTLEGIKAGVIDATLVQRPYTMGRLAIEKLKGLIEGTETPKDIDTGVVVVTSDNLDSYTK